MSVDRLLGQRTPGGQEMVPLLCRWLGRTRYEDAVRLQEKLVTDRRAGRVGDVLLLTEHEPVVTLGRACGPQDVPDEGLLAARGVALYRCSRGGKATYHGPGQLVGYLIRDLGAPSAVRDLHAFLDRLEEAVRSAAQELGVRAEVRPGLRGVWVHDRKLAALGVAVRGWVTYHGFALNVAPDLAAFGLITPCGMAGVQATSLLAETGRQPDDGWVREVVARHVAREFGYRVVTESNTVSL